MEELCTVMKNIIMSYHTIFSKETNLQHPFQSTPTLLQSKQSQPGAGSLHILLFVSFLVLSNPVNVYLI